MQDIRWDPSRRRVPIFQVWTQRYQRVALAMPVANEITKTSQSQQSP